MEDPPLCPASYSISSECVSTASGGWVRLDALDSQLKSIAQTCICPGSTSVILHSLHQVFPIDFSATTFRFSVVGDSTCQKVDINYPFSVSVGGHRRASPYTSAADFFGITFSLKLTAVACR